MIRTMTTPRTTPRTSTRTDQCPARMAQGSSNGSRSPLPRQCSPAAGRKNLLSLAALPVLEVLRRFHNYGPSEPVTNQVLGSYQIQSLRKGLSGVLRARRVAITQCATYPAPRIFPLLPALARWTVPNVYTAILKDCPAIDCCEAVYVRHFLLKFGWESWVLHSKRLGLWRHSMTSTQA